MKQPRLNDYTLWVLQPDAGKPISPIQHETIDVCMRHARLALLDGAEYIRIDAALDHDYEYDCVFRYTYNGIAFKDLITVAVPDEGNAAEYAHELFWQRHDKKRVSLVSVDITCTNDLEDV